MRITKLTFLLFVILLCLQSVLWAQTTGKIAGTIVDAKTYNPLPGSNVILNGTNIGAAVDSDGSYFILNVPPGSYTVRIQMMGYETVIVENVRVSVNRTVEVNASLKETTILGQEVVIIADRMTIKKDQTSSIRNVSSGQMDILPTESISGIVDMQPGVVLGHFRGGRKNEVTYMIDGIQVDESFSRDGQTVRIEKDAVEDLEVITGIFSAKYGNAMSGVVNAITKNGGNQFHGSISSAFSNYITDNKDIFIGLKDSDFARRQDYQLSLNGPVLRDRLFFAMNIRHQDNNGHLNGINRFNVDDYNNFLASDPSGWHSENTGDNEYVAMQKEKLTNFWGKLSFSPIQVMKMSLQYFFNREEGQKYNHIYKYNPAGLPTQYHDSQMLAFQVNHTLSPSAFYEFKLSYVDNYTGSYVYENPLDSRYVHDQYFRNQGSGFYTGGQSKEHIRRTMKDVNGKFDLVWQLNRQHSLETGFTYTQHDLDNKSSQIRNKYYSSEFETLFETDSITNKRTYLYYEPITMSDSSAYSDIYQTKPIEFGYYLQDKMEFDEMVINLGVRFDYFDPKVRYPSQLRNPANQLNFPNNPEKISTYPNAEPKYQFSPRLGLSYQLGKTALLRFGYGHFLQMPPLYSMYQNHSLLVPPSDYGVTTGNPQIEAQKTIQYEVGLWQELTDNMSLEVALFYRDIYDLQSAKIITTFNQIRYGLYSNKDYANARGLELKYEFISGGLSAFLNYTLQFSRGNAETPDQTFDRAGNDKDPVNKLIPMSWDQRHTLNATVGYNTARYGTTLSLYYNSGTPFTWRPIMESPLTRINLFPNNTHQSSRFSADLNAYINLLTYKDMKLRMTLLVYNLFDNLNDMIVDPTTGRAYTSIIRQTDIISHKSDFNEYKDRIQNPVMYSEPRMIKIGMQIQF